MNQAILQKKDTRGFTLIEVVVVLAVIFILSSIVLPHLSQYTKKSKEIQCTNHETLVQNAIHQFYAYEGDYPNLSNLNEDELFPLSQAQETQLRDLLYRVTAIRINIEDYTYQYNEATGECSLALQ